MYSELSNLQLLAELIPDILRNMEDPQSTEVDDNLSIRK
jgi:hypothetical protein